MNLNYELESVLGEQPGIRILNSMGFAIATLNTDLNIVWCNLQYLQMFKVLNNNIQGRHCYEVSFNRDRPCPLRRCPVLKTFETGLEDRFLGIAYKTEQGIKFLDIYCFPIKNPDDAVTHVVEVINDNTKLHELVRLSENAAMLASHELKTPLTAIATLARAAMYPNMPDDKKERFLYRIISRAESAVTMIEEFLTMSAISLGELKIQTRRVNFYNEVMEKVLDQQQEPMAEKGMNARVDIPWELEVVCDPRYMQLVYNNLISNATKYGTIGTEVYLGYSGPQDGYHYFNVVNEGDWIKEKDKDRIFEKYETLGKKSSGLGLHTAREVVKKHGGDIWLDLCYYAMGKWISKDTITNETMIAEEYLNQLSKGNSFVFTIPAKYENTEESE